MKYNYIFILNVPAFYKVNLLNKLAKQCSIYVIFLGVTDQVIINNKHSSAFEFEYTILSNNDIDSKRNIVFNLYKMIMLLRKIKFEKIVYGGWDNLEMLLLLLITKKIKNCIICESSIYDSKITGIKSIFKKIILSRISNAFVSGEAHKLLFEKLNYKGKIHITGGVGLPLRSIRNLKKRNKDFKYIYTGRLIEKKNLELLISVFNKNGKYLTIVGKGILENRLKKMANSNISFIGFVDNENLGILYNQFDCFILPSKTEQWGLVVEEALFYGLPVIVSNRVGCNIDLIQKYNSGVIFEFSNEDDLENKIKQIEGNYHYYMNNVNTIDFNKRDRDQINTYLNVLKL